MSNLLVALGAIAVTALLGPWWALSLLSVCVMIQWVGDWLEERAEAAWREQREEERRERHILACQRRGR